MESFLARAYITTMNKQLKGSLTMYSHLMLLEMLYHA